MKHYSLVKVSNNYGNEYVWFYGDKPLCHDVEGFSYDYKRVVKSKRKGLLTRMMLATNSEFNGLVGSDFVNKLIVDYYVSFPSMVNKVEIKQRMNVKKEIQKIFESERDPKNVCIMFYETNGTRLYTRRFTYNEQTFYKFDEEKVDKFCGSIHKNTYEGPDKKQDCNHNPEPWLCSRQNTGRIRAYPCKCQ